MIEIFHFFMALLAFLTLNRIVIWFYFKDEIVGSCSSNELRDNPIRNQTEPSGITPGTVTYEQPLYAPLESPYQRWVAAQGVKARLKWKMGKWK